MSIPGDGQKEGTDSAESASGQSGAEYVSVEVTVGVSDDSYLEVISGLQEGDTVAYIPTTSSGSSFQMGMMPDGGGMPGGGGGMPGGGGPGGF